jgi:broad specificity phosphatase PhoE
MLDLPDALWFVDFYLRERDKGVLVGKSPDERVAKYPDFIEHLDSSPLYARPPGLS